MLKVKILNSIYAKIEDKRDLKLIQPCLSYTSIWYYQAQYRKVKKSNTAYFIASRKDSEVYLGHLQRILKYCKKKKIEVEIDKANLEVLKPTNKPSINGITFREDQERLINTAIEQQRGIILSPTGSGKTIIASGIISCFKNKKVLFLCHSVDILNQTKKEFEKFGFKNISMIGGGKKQKLNDITLATDKSFKNLPIEDWCDFFDITIIDEAHHLSSRKVIYADIMSYNLSPMKIGFTATIPSESKKKEAVLTLEGFIGPVIGELSMEEAIEKGILSKPKIKLVSVPQSKDIKDKYSRYKDIYQYAIVSNRKRNMMIIEEVQKNVEKNQTSLIMVKEIQHGKEIMKMGKLLGNKIRFVRGSTVSEQREEIKDLLNRKKVDAVIATAVWREGINIPTLDCIINACGGKSEIMTLQAIGRGLRTADGKSTVKIIDFLDDYDYVIAHSLKRIRIYVENGWIGGD